MFPHASLATTLKRLILGYLGFFFLAALGALSVRAAALFEPPPAKAEHDSGGTEASS